MDTKPEIVDFEEILKTWAWKQYITTSKGIFKLNYKHANIQLNWDRVKQTLVTPVYKERSLESTRQKVIVESEYENTTDIDQTHTFRTERETESTAAIVIRKGFRRSVNTEIQLTLPPDMVDGDTEGSGSTSTNTSGKRKSELMMMMKKQQATASFGNYLHVDTEEGNTVRKSLKWGVDTTITSKRGKTTIASLEIDESTFAYSFKAEVEMRGKIIAVITDSRREGKQLLTVEGDLANVLKEMAHTHPEVSRQFEFRTNQRQIYVTVEGDVVFKYGVSQRVKVAYAKQEEQASRMYPALDNQ